MKNAHQIVDDLIDRYGREISPLYLTAEENIKKLLSDHMKKHEKEIVDIYKKYLRGELSETTMTGRIQLLLMNNKEFKELREIATSEIYTASMEAAEVGSEYLQRAEEVASEEETAKAKKDFPTLAALAVALGALTLPKQKNTINKEKEIQFIKHNITVVTMSKVSLSAKLYCPKYGIYGEELWQQTATKAAKGFTGKVPSKISKITIEKSFKSMKRGIRTKMTIAENLGRQVIYNVLGAVGVEGNKVWRTQGDSKVRDAHAAMEGVSVPMDEPFIVEGFEMMYPGDTSGGATADLIYNCRCWMEREKKER